MSSLWFVNIILIMLQLGLLKCKYIFPTSFAFLRFMRPTMSTFPPSTTWAFILSKHFSGIKINLFSIIINIIIIFYKSTGFGILIIYFCNLMFSTRSEVNIINSWEIFVLVIINCIFISISTLSPVVRSWIYKFSGFWILIIYFCRSEVNIINWWLIFILVNIYSIFISISALSLVIRIWILKILRLWRKRSKRCSLGCIMFIIWCVTITLWIFFSFFSVVVFLRFFFFIWRKILSHMLNFLICLNVR